MAHGRPGAPTAAGRGDKHVVTVFVLAVAGPTPARRRGRPGAPPVAAPGSRRTRCGRRATPRSASCEVGCSCTRKTERHHRAMTARPGRPGQTRHFRRLPNTIGGRGVLSRRAADSLSRAPRRTRRTAAPAAAGRDVAGERGLGLGARRAVLARSHTQGGLDSRECWRRAPG